MELGDDPELVHAARGLGTSLVADRVAIDVAQALTSAGVPCILLRGPAIARALYAVGFRPYVDVDFLVRPVDVSRAEQVLERHGFTKLPYTAAQPPRHAEAWVHGSHPISVDLHQTLVGVGVQPETLWEELANASEPLAVEDRRLVAVGRVGVALVVPLHGAQHGRQSAPMEDLERALATFSRDEWRDAAELARRLQALSAFAAGLRMRPDGEQLADELRLPRDYPAEVALRAGGTPPLALGVSGLAGLHGTRSKLRYIAKKLLPSPAYMQAQFRLARRGRAGLAAAYVWRWFWMVRHIGPALRAIRRARREARSS